MIPSLDSHLPCSVLFFFFAVILPCTTSLECYDAVSKFSIPCEELRTEEKVNECYALYNYTDDKRWSMMDAGCSGALYDEYRMIFESDFGTEVKMLADRQLLVRTVRESVMMATCLEDFCNRPKELYAIIAVEEAIQRGEANLIEDILWPKEENSTHTSTPTPPPSKNKKKMFKSRLPFRQ